MLYHTDPPCCMAASLQWPSLKTKSEHVQYWLCKGFIRIYQPCHTLSWFFTHVVEQLCCLDHLNQLHIDIQSRGVSVLSVINDGQTKVLLTQPSGRIKWRFRWLWVSVQCFRTHGGGWRSIWKIESDGALYRYDTCEPCETIHPITSNHHFCGSGLAWHARWSLTVVKSAKLTSSPRGRPNGSQRNSKDTSPSRQK